ncbi:hypothetical protein BOX15_Mlig028747g1 [Macrostomum lignano]|uniref:Uncharacterized protein n=2 Tax=Macrostomum lignano TaxID=282301 RepID=A0A267FIK4_9PLAT|nr:hypothetical protein BOX15_Mlig014416g1 [Macrostomum lignano]PAA73611.1 hypothetical protein BOX15_Mlig028747g1 [Macrostomum lignano]
MPIPAALQRFCSAMWRTKTLNQGIMSTPLKRCLNTFDLILIGIGNMSGAGIYVLTGTVVRRKAGPATCIAYFVAGLTAFLNGLCYSELGARVPRAGSAYSYTYVAMGELLAFVIGWSIILEYILSAASIARGFSGTLDALTSDAISNWTVSHVGTFYQTSPNDTSTIKHIISHYPDLMSVLLIIVVAVILSIGANLSKHFNTVTTSVNVVVLLFISGVMFALADLANWREQPFMPFGFTGVLSGAATCFYAFIGFDAISVSTEEALTPQKSLPMATSIAVFVTTVLLVISSAAITLFEPWYLIDIRAAFTSAFLAHRLQWAEIITGIGSITGIVACLYCNNYAMPRVVYAMASDGLIFRILAYVTPLTQVPIVAIIFSSFIAAVLALLLDIEALADFLSIGTLIAYSIVACNVVIMRYSRPAGIADIAALESEVESTSSSQLPLTPEKPMPAEDVGRLKAPFRSLPLLRSLQPGFGAIMGLLIFVGSLISVSLIVKLGSLSATNPILIIVLVLFGLICLLAFGVMLMHDQDTDIRTFKVPAVPLLPCVAIAFNVVLILQLQPMTWIRFSIWLVIGLLIYFTYGINQSNENPDRQREASEKVPLASAMKLPESPGMEGEGPTSKKDESDTAKQ